MSTLDRSRSRPPFRSTVGISVIAGLGAVLLAFLAIGAVSYTNVRTLWSNVELAEHTQQVLLSLSNLFSLVKDAETGQRGFVITGDEKYLAPHTQAVDRIHGQLAELEERVRDNPEQRDHLPALRARLPPNFTNWTRPSPSAARKGLPQPKRKS